MSQQVVAGWIINAMERGRIPDGITRRLIGRLCRTRLNQVAREYRETAASGNCGLQDFADRMRCGPVAPVPEKANQQHYEVPADFFALMLGPCFKYSCCFFASDQASLEEAELTSLQMTCEHADLQDGQQVLETGCGWGSLTLYMLEQYPNLTVTAVSNSASQREFIEQRAATAGVRERLTVITADMNDFAPDRLFDRIVSCEMFEHMRNYEVLLHRMSGWLEPAGKMLIHIFCHRDYAYEFEADGQTNWMGRYFFTGGIMPSRNLLDQFNRHLQVTRSWDWDGTHYQRTCEAWLKRLDANREPALAILARVYGPDQAHRWLHRWRMFLLAGSELFGHESGRQWQVGHFLLEPVPGRAREPVTAEVLPA